MIARVGVVGCGWWASQAHLPALARNPDAVIAAIAEPDEEKRRIVAERHDVAAAFAGAEEMLDAVDLDGVVIAVPHVLHYPIARAALELGLHVLLEKPMTILPEHARELAALARERGVELVIGYPWHYNEQVLSLRETIAAGRIGEIEYVSCLFASIVRELYAGNPEAYREWQGDAVALPGNRTYSDPAVAGGGQGQTQITHSAALMLWLTGLEVESVTAVSERFELEVDLVDALALRFANGAIGALGSTGSMTMHQPEILEYRIFGRDGHVLFDVNNGTASIHLADGAVERLPELPSANRYPEGAPADNLVDVVLGRAPNGSPADVGVASVELVDAMYRSARQGKAVRLGAGPGRERVGHVWCVKPGKAEEYARLHERIWPELEELLLHAGVSTYTIYAWGEILFSHLETDDFTRLVERFNDDPVARRWEKQFAEILEYPNADSETGWPERLRKIWGL
jgi:predicted dehydrogenase/L-rhamnose mutarotase